MAHIKYVFFDLGYTLVNEDAVWKQRCREQADMEEAKEANVTPDKIYGEICKASAAFLSPYRTALKACKLTAAAPYRHELEKLYSGAQPVLEALSKTYSLGVIANQASGLNKRLSEFSILQYFSVVISSGDFQINKPDIRLFEIALQKVRCRPAETVMIGDRLDNDIFPAKAAGMKTVWIKQGFGGFQRPIGTAYIPDFEINRLEELLRIL